MPRSKFSDILFTIWSFPRGNHSFISRISPSLFEYCFWKVLKVHESVKFKQLDGILCNLIVASFEIRGRNFEGGVNSSVCGLSLCWRRLEQHPSLALEDILVSPQLAYSLANSCSGLYDGKGMTAQDFSNCVGIFFVSASQARFNIASFEKKFRSCSLIQPLIAVFPHILVIRTFGEACSNQYASVLSGWEKWSQVHILIIRVVYNKQPRVRCILKPRNCTFDTRIVMATSSRNTRKAIGDRSLAPPIYPENSPESGEH